MRSAPSPPAERVLSSPPLSPSLPSPPSIVVVVQAAVIAIVPLPSPNWRRSPHPAVPWLAAQAAWCASTARHGASAAIAAPVSEM